MDETPSTVYILYQKEVQNIEHSFLQSIMDWIYNSRDSIYKYRHKNKAYLTVSRLGILIEQDQRSLTDYPWTSILFNLKYLREIYVDRYHKDTCVLVSKISSNNSTNNNIWKRANQNVYQGFQSLSNFNHLNKTYLITVLKFKEGANRLLLSIQKLDRVLTEISRHEKQRESSANRTRQVLYNHQQQWPISRQSSINDLQNLNNIPFLVQQQNFYNQQQHSATIGRSFGKHFTNSDSSDNISEIGYQQYTKRLTKNKPVVVSSTSSLRNSDLSMMSQYYNSNNNNDRLNRTRSSSMQTNRNSLPAANYYHRSKSPEEKKSDAILNSHQSSLLTRQSRRSEANFYYQPRPKSANESDELISDDDKLSQLNKNKYSFPSMSNSNSTNLNNNIIKPIRFNANQKPPSPQILNLSPDLRKLTEKKISPPPLPKLQQQENEVGQKETSRFKELVDLFNNYEKKSAVASSSPPKNELSQVSSHNSDNKPNKAEPVPNLSNNYFLLNDIKASKLMNPEKKPDENLENFYKSSLGVEEAKSNYADFYSSKNYEIPIITQDLNDLSLSNKKPEQTTLYYFKETSLNNNVNNNYFIEPQLKQKQQENVDLLKLYNYYENKESAINEYLNETIVKTDNFSEFNKYHGVLNEVKNENLVPSVGGSGYYESTEPVSSLNTLVSSGGLIAESNNAKNVYNEMLNDKGVEYDLATYGLDASVVQGVLEQVSSYQTIVQHQKKMNRRRTFANMIWPMDQEEERIMRSNSPMLVPEVIVQRNDAVKSILKKNNAYLPHNGLFSASSTTTNTNTMAANPFARKRVDFHENFCFVNIFEKSPHELSAI